MVKKSKAKARPRKKVSPKRSSKPAAAGRKPRDYVKTGITGLDQLFEKGIPKNSNILVAGGAGSGKTIMCLQILNNAVKDGKKKKTVPSIEPMYARFFAFIGLFAFGMFTLVVSDNLLYLFNQHFFHKVSLVYYEDS